LRQANADRAGRSRRLRESASRCVRTTLGGSTGDQVRATRDRRRAADLRSRLPASLIMEAPETVRWRLDLGYRGTDFSGWAAQPGRRTVQGVLEDWLPKLLRIDPP